MFGLCKVSRARGRDLCIEFLDMSVVLIHSLSDGSFSFTNVLETTLSALYNVNDIT